MLDLRTLPHFPAEVPSDDTLANLYGLRWLRLVRKMYERAVLRTVLGEAQNWHCCHCGAICTDEHGTSRLATLEHVLPASRGGKNVVEHCAMACAGCNNKRADDYHEVENLIEGALSEAVVRERLRLSRGVPKSPREPTGMKRQFAHITAFYRTRTPSNKEAIDGMGRPAELQES